MADLVKFSKWHGLGNDFIIIDDRRNSRRFSRKQVAFLGDRNFGIGCDQLMIIRKSTKADFRMDLYNQDGSRAEMCGNGIRCFAMYLLKRRITRKTDLAIETDAGIIRTSVKGRQVKVDMGEPVLDGPAIPVLMKGSLIAAPLETEAGKFSFTAVSMGNPHAVIFVEDASAVDLERNGPVIENHPLFPNRTNVEFAQVLSNRKVKLRVWERGAGATLACGTGACATAVAGALNGLTGRTVSVVLPGGTLKIRWDKKSNHVFMTGPAVEVFNGAVLL